MIENVTYSGGAVWAAEGDVGTIVRIDPTTNEQRVYRLGHHLDGVAAGNGVVAVGVQQSAQDVTAGLKGRIVHLALKDDYLDWSSPDPAASQTAFNPYQVQFQYATCAKLFNYRDASGAAGQQLVPEVAAGWPRVSDEGHTYTFRIRSGYRFSPPSNAPVTAASFAREIERVLSPRLQPGPWKLALLPDVVGAVAYHAGKTAHVSGVNVHGDLLVIRLVKPASDLPARLAEPDFCAVPVRTPIVLNGVASPIPSAGPYYLAAQQGDAFVLKRNPNYPGPRPQRVDAIVYRTHVDIRRAVTRWRKARSTTSRGRCRTRTGCRRSAGGSGRYRLTANNWTERLALNPHRPLFADAQARHAVAYALDRHALVAGLRRRDRLPDERRAAAERPGARAGAGYPLDGDLSVARRLIGRTSRPSAVRDVRRRHRRHLRPPCSCACSASARGDQHLRDGRPRAANRQPGAAIRTVLQLRTSRGSRRMPPRPATRSSTFARCRIFRPSDRTDLRADREPALAWSGSRSGADRSPARASAIVIGVGRSRNAGA